MLLSSLCSLLVIFVIILKQNLFLILRVVCCGVVLYFSYQEKELRVLLNMTQKLELGGLNSCDSFCIPAVGLTQ